MIKVRTGIFGSVKSENRSYWGADKPENEGAETYVEFQIYRLAFVSAAIKALPCIVLAMLAGPWSDRFGRKLLIALPLIGFVIADAVFVTLASIETVGPDYILFETIHDLFGGIPLLMLGAFAYIVDVAPKETRSSRMAILEAVFLVGLALGDLVGGPIDSFAGHSPIYILSLILILAGILSVPAFLKLKQAVNKSDQVPIMVTEDPELEVPSTSMMKIFFKPKNVSQTLAIGTQKPESGNRGIVWILILIFFFLELVTLGEKITDVMYVRETFPSEDLAAFTMWWNTFYAIFTAWGIFCLAVMVPVLKQVYHFCDPTIILIAVIGGFLRSITFLLATDRAHLFIGSFVDMFNLAGIVATRSSLASLVDDKDIGKLFGLLAVVQSIASGLSPLYHLMFEGTQNFHPGLSFCIHATIYIIIGLAAIYLILHFRRNRIGYFQKPEFVETEANVENIN
ncbi:hypothetical protein TCAL_07739 [Tigriopus californicus]|uniref:Major facilitator superfamily (MFS) profile domain-containing protein n=1 Tax=Tigriopus californicus TaxID=6832 RepID=A0A553PLK6_TIGCA|nr:hypothetical protein TCAL_07739 [Tigriopus californicus]|eukprot:TCALIF_07739-PA protein Name:"Similar to slc46a1 Proton-coupled folate transporter (Danio rerio)" AED:0.06 eAED:0.08 QI:0/0/0/0.33/1/1/3/0/454